MSDAEPDIRQDPDVIHLRHLLSLLPGPDEDEWWSWCSTRHAGYREKLERIAEGVSGTDPIRLAYGCRYLLLFFSNGDAEMWDRLDTPSLNLPLDDYERPGRLLAEDICRTAWTLFVRYTHHHQDWGKQDGVKE